MKYLYTGWFVQEQELFQKAEEIAPERLERRIVHPHITLEFKPEIVDTGLFGSLARIMVTGYGNDGKNEGFLVRVEAENPDLQAVVDKLETPHITLSIAEDGKAVNTRSLSFREIEPFFLEGVFGGMTEKNTPVFEA